MKRITIDIDIKNTLEIVKHRKGRILAFLAKYVIKEESMRDEVEKRIMDEIQKNLEMNLQFKLQQEGIKAHINIQQTDPGKMT